MWAAWTASPTSSPSSSVTDAAASTQSVAAVLDTSSLAGFPQRRLLSTASRCAREKWSQLRTSPSSVRSTVAVAAGVIVVVVIAGVMRTRCARRSGGTCRHRRCGYDGTDENASTAAKGSDDVDNVDGDDIDFADPAESAFNAYVHRIKRQKESVLVSAITQLESAVAELESSRDAAETSTVKDDANNSNDGHLVELRAKVHRAAVVADELLTQWICSLDGVPVRGRERLKQRRKELVQNAALLHQRIAPYLHHTPASAATENGGTAEEAA
jgi:hypothetical protein